MSNEWGLTNWPPADMPPWPDFYAADWRSLAFELQQMGWTVDQPTGGERNKWVKDTRDGDEHSVRGIIVVSPDGTRYPFAICTDLSHLELLVPYVPYSMGTLSG